MYVFSGSRAFHVHYAARMPGLAVEAMVLGAEPFTVWEPVWVMSQARRKCGGWFSA